MSDLLRQFVAQECSREVTSLVAEALRDPTRARVKLELNRFELTIEPASSIVVVDDVLDASEAGSQRVSIDELVACLAETA